MKNSLIIKTLFTLIFASSLFISFSFVADAQNRSYTPISPITDLGINSGQAINLGNYLNALYRGGIIIATVLAVIMITIGAIEYMGSESVFTKGEGKKRITMALLGLILALSSWIILGTIDEQLLQSDISDIPNTPTIQSESLSYNPLTLGPEGNSEVQYRQYLQQFNLTPEQVRDNPNLLNNQNVQDINHDFTNEDFNELALEAVRNSGLSNIDVSQIRDAERFFPDPNNVTDQDWANLLGAMSRLESNQNPNLRYTESFRNGRGERVISTGLLQLSYESVNGYNVPGVGRVTTGQLQNPQTNLNAGAHILNQWVRRDGVIAGSNNTGGARYWSIFRNSGKTQSISNSLLGN
jgi:hypothetical protein